MQLPERDLPHTSSEQTTLRFGLITLLLALVVQWLVYFDSFRILPASDDFPIVNEIHRGNQQGPGVFFTDSVILIGWRPLKSAVIWAMGNLFWPRPMVGVRLANLLAAVGCGAVVLLWSRSIRLGRAGTIAAIALMLLHPVMPASIGSCDGIDTVASTALLWLGAWLIYHFRERPIAAILAAAICFLVGVAFKENLFALVPLALVIVFMFWERSRRTGAIALLVTLAILAAAMIAIRFYVIRGGLSAGASMLRFSPRQLAENVAIFGTGLFFFADSIWVFLHQSRQVMAFVGLWCLIALTVIGTGIWLRWRDVPSRRWIVFLLLGMACAAFPTILLYHVSEMYVPPMVVPFALLCGFAADGLRQARNKAIQVGAAAVAGLALVLSIAAIRDKIAGLRDVGDRAADQVAQVLSFLPADAHDLKIAVLFDRVQLKPKRTYSVFLMGDEILMVHKDVLNWPRPGKHLILMSPSLDEAPTFDVSSVDVALKWDATTRKFTRVK